MRKTTMRAAIAGIVTGGALLAGGQALAQGGETAFHAHLSGANEIDADTGDRGAGDGNGYGSAAITIRGRQVCWGITAARLDAPAAAHIHRGGARVNGPVVVELSAPEEGAAGASSGCTRGPRDVVQAIVRNPGRFYVNVHTQDFAGGAIRGQLGR